MAYTQTPGREKLPPGNNIPNEFKTNNEPPVTPVATTPKYAAGVKNYQSNLAVKNQGREDIKVNVMTSEASANEFKRDVINEPDGMTRIVGSGGQLFYGRTGSKETVNAVNASNAKVKTVNTQRQNNSNFWNINSGATPVPEFTEKDKATMLNLGKLKPGQ